MHFEVGPLRKLLVWAPGLAHERLTPSDCDDLLFDDVLGVQNARRDHFDFMSKLRERAYGLFRIPYRSRPSSPQAGVAPTPP